GRAASGLATAVLQRGGALPDLRLVPRPPGVARRGRRDPPGPMGPAGACTLEASQLSQAPVTKEPGAGGSDLFLSALLVRRLCERFASYMASSARRKRSSTAVGSPACVTAMP